MSLTDGDQERLSIALTVLWWLWKTSNMSGWVVVQGSGSKLGMPLRRSSEDGPYGIKQQKGTMDESPISTAFDRHTVGHDICQLAPLAALPMALCRPREGSIRFSHMSRKGMVPLGDGAEASEWSPR